MLEMFEHAILENQFVAAFAVVGIIVWRVSITWRTT